MRIKTTLALVLLAATAWASGQIGVTGYPAVPRVLKGGTGINISTDGTFTATGEAVAVGTVPFENISSALRGKYLGSAATSANTNAYKGNSAPSATEFNYLQGVTGALQTQINAKAATSSLATVATTGAYSDLTGKPTLSTVAGTGAYADLTGKPALATVATSGAYTDLTGKPALATVATSGSYTDLTSKPTIPAAQVNTDWNASSGVAQILNKPSLATVATTGSYTDLSNKPAQYTLPTASTTVLGGVKVDGTSVVIDGAGRISSTVSAGVSSFNSRSGAVNPAAGDYAVADVTGLQTALDLKANTSILAAVATSGAYSSLSGKPTLGTSAAKDVPATGNASSTQVPLGNDTRLSDSRHPVFMVYSGGTYTALSKEVYVGTTDPNGANNTVWIDTSATTTSALDAKANVNQPTITGWIAAPEFRTTSADGTRGTQCWNTGDMDTASFTAADAGTECWNMTMGRNRVYDGSQLQSYVFKSEYDAYVSSTQAQITAMQASIATLTAAVAGGGTYTPTPPTSGVSFYANANSLTSTQSPQTGAGSLAVGASVSSTTGFVSNAWQINPDGTSATQVSFPTTNNIDRTTGTLGMYLKLVDSTESSLIVSADGNASPYFQLSRSNATGNVNFNYKNISASIPSSAVPFGSWVFVELAWNGTAISYRVNGGTWATEVTGATGSAATASTFIIGSTAASATTFAVDQLLIAGTYKYDLYAVRNNTGGF